jgi:hypothetical protein
MSTCTFMPAEQWPVTPQMKYRDPAAARGMASLPVMCVATGLDMLHAS